MWLCKIQVCGNMWMPSYVCLCEHCYECRIWFHLCLMRWVHCACTWSAKPHVPPQGSFGRKSMSSRVCECVKYVPQRHLSVFVWAWVWRLGVKRRRILLVTLWSFFRWQMFAGLLAANILYGTVTFGWCAPENNITFESIRSSVTNVNFKNFKVRKRNPPDKFPQPPHNLKWFYEIVSAVNNFCFNKISDSSNSLVNGSQSLVWRLAALTSPGN